MLNVTDFGKNTFQCEIAFRFDCLSPDGYWILGNAVASKDPPWHFGKDAQHGLILTKGDGSKEAPFQQIKFAPDKIVLWAGWNFHYERWIAWCTNLINSISPSQGFPSIYVLQFNTQANLLIPFSKLRKFSEIPDFKPLYDIYQTYIPEAFLAKGSHHLVFATEDSTRIIEIRVVGDLATQESNVGFLYRETVLDAQRSIVQNLEDHLTAFNTHFSKYHDAVLRPSIFP